mmetsp:Transcript_68375/g.164101  ORF Transcript_68375/g.164101 Transcript_68375/m.164101 type:complete len:392 (+) Transcript_68375:74-1249(+)
MSYGPCASSLAFHQYASAPYAVPQPGGGQDLSSKIVDKLRKLVPGSTVAQAPSNPVQTMQLPIQNPMLSMVQPQVFPGFFPAPAGVPVMPSVHSLAAVAAVAPAPDQQLGGALLTSLRSLSNSGSVQAYGATQAGIELFQKVQELNTPAAGMPMVISSGSNGGLMTLPAPADPTPRPPPEPAAPRRPEPQPVYPTEVMSADELASFQGPDDGTNRPSEDNEADEADEDGEDAPHRLPPGFGAIPEDLIIEKARAREEERLRAVKAQQPCRFGRACKKRDCPNQHPEGRSIDNNLNPCAFGRRCKRLNCFYDHPEGRLIDEDPNKGICRLGRRCKRPDCLYTHPEGRDAPSTGEVKVCFYCHDTGHIAQDCTKNPDSWAFRGSTAIVPVSNR